MFLLFLSVIDLTERSMYSNLLCFILCAIEFKFHLSDQMKYHKMIILHDVDAFIKKHAAFSHVILC